MPVITTNTTAQNAASVNASKVSFNTTVVSKASVQNNISVQPASTPSNSVQEASHNAAIPKKSTSSDISAPAQSTSAASVSATSVGSSIVTPASAGSAQSKSSASTANTSNALPETGMANEGIEFAATMLALAGITMVKREHEE